MASSLYQTKKTLDTNHPSLAEKAREYGEKMRAQRQEREQQTSQSFKKIRAKNGAISQLSFKTSL